MATNDVKIVLTAKDETGGAFGSVKNGLAGMATQAKDAVNGVGALGAAFGVLGGVAAGALSVSALRGSVNMLDELDDLSEKTGIATEALSALKYAGEVVGTPLEALATGVRKLSINMAAAAGGGKDQAAAFAAIGVSVKNLDGSLRGSDKVLGDIADKFASFRDGPEKAALAVDLFGKAGADMIPLLNKGSAGIADLRTEAERLGVVFSGDLAANAAEFNDNLKKIQLSGQTFATTMAGEVLPSLNEVAAVFLESSDGSNSLAKTLGEGLKVALEAVVITAADVAFVLKGIGREIGAIGAQTVALAKLDIKGFNAISEAVKADGVSARKELDALQARILGVGNSSTYKDPRILGSVGSIREQAEALKSAAPVIQKVGDSAKTAADEFQKLLDKIQGKASGTDTDFTKNISLLNKALASGKLTWDEYAKVVGQYIAQQPAAIEATKALTKEMEAAQKVAEERQAARLKEDAGIQEWIRSQKAAAAASLKSINDRITGIQLEEEATAMATEQNISLAQAIEQVTIARLREQQAVLVAGSDAYNNVEKEIEARERLIGVINTKDLRERETTGWAQVFASIDTTAHDTWTNVWESGSGAFKRLGQTLKASILDALYQIAIRPIMVKIGASVLGTGFAGAANAATGNAGSVLGSISNLSSIGQSIAGYIGLGGATSAGIAANTALAGTIGITSAEAAAAASAAGAAASGGMAAAMGPVLQGLMTAAPYLAAVAAVYAIAKSLDHSGTPHTGGGSQYSASSGLTSTAVGQWTRGTTFGDGFGSVMGDANTTTMTAGLVQSIVGILDSTATTFGKTAGYAAATSFADDSSKDPAWGSLVIKQLDNVLVNWNDTRTSKWAPRQFSDGSAGSQEYLAAISADVRSALDQIGLPEWASQTLDALGASPSLDQLAAAVAEINKTQAALTGIGKVLTGFSGLSDGAVQALLKASGGIDKLSAAASTYYENFYTTAEKTAAVTGSVSDALAAVGLQMPTTRAEFRSLVESQQALGEAGAPALAALLQVSGAFASVVPAAEDLSTAVDNVATTVTRSTADIAASLANLKATTGSLQVDLLTAQGDTTGARALQRSLDTAGFTDAEIAVYDFNTTLRDLITTTNAATEATRAEAEQRTSLQNTLLQALGETSTLRQRELDALPAANRELQQMINTVTDAQSAISSLNADIARLDQVAKQAATLSNSLSVMLGGTDNTESGLWATVNSATATAEDKLTAISQLMGIINTSITTDTAAAQKALTDGATAAADAINKANAAQQEAANTQLANAQKLLDVGKQLRDYVAGLLTGSLSALTPGQKLAQAAGSYNTTLSAAQGGDATALSQLTGNANTYLELARQYDPASYNRIFGEVTGTLDQLGGSLMTDGERAALTAQATLDSIKTVSTSTAATTAAVLTGNVISDANRQALESLLGLTTQIQADAAIEKAAKQAEVTAANARMDAIRASLSDAGVIAVSVSNTASVMTSFAQQQKTDNADLRTQIAELTTQVQALQTTLVDMTALQVEAAAAAAAANAATVAGAVTTAVSEAAGVPVIA